MKNRCYNKKYHHYKDYGGRGIRVEKRWLDFKNFYDDMSEEYERFNRTALKRSDRATIERIDNNKNYSKDNCRFCSYYDQSRNKRNNVWVEYNGERLIVSDWAKKTGIKSGTLRRRLKSGWPVALALGYGQK